MQIAIGGQPVYEPAVSVFVSPITGRPAEARSCERMNNFASFDAQVKQATAAFRLPINTYLMADYKQSIKYSSTSCGQANTCEVRAPSDY